jgi:hypothetical protein
MNTIKATVFWTAETNMVEFAGTGVNHKDHIEREMALEFGSVEAMRAYSLRNPTYSIHVHAPASYWFFEDGVCYRNFHDYDMRHRPELYGGRRA